VDRIKVLLSQQAFSKGELKSSSLLDRKRAKGSPPEKKHHR
jgi:hypothetical protein